MPNFIVNIGGKVMVDAATKEEAKEKVEKDMMDKGIEETFDWDPLEAMDWD